MEVAVESVVRLVYEHGCEVVIAEAAIPILPAEIDGLGVTALPPMTSRVVQTGPSGSPSPA